MALLLTPSAAGHSLTTLDASLYANVAPSRGISCVALATSACKISELRLINTGLGFESHPRLHPYIFDMFLKIVRRNLTCPRLLAQKPSRKLDCSRYERN